MLHHILDGDLKIVVFCIGGTVFVLSLILRKLLLRLEVTETSEVKDTSDVFDDLYRIVGASMVLSGFSFFRSILLPTLPLFEIIECIGLVFVGFILYNLMSNSLTLDISNSGKSSIINSSKLLSLPASIAIFLFVVLESIFHLIQFLQNRS